MESLKNTLAQLQKLYQSFSPSQRGTLAVVTLLVPLVFYFVVIRGDSGSMTPALYGRRLNMEEMNVAQTALFDANLNEFDTRSGQLLVPASELDRYNSTLLSSAGLTAYAGSLPSEEEKALKDLPAFASNSQFNVAMSSAKEKQIARLIETYEGIDMAMVKWAPSNNRGWRHSGPAGTASVSVRPRAGYQLTRQQISGIRQMVANSLPGILAQHVSVMDLSTLNHYGAEDENDPTSDRLLRLTREHERSTAEDLMMALRHIPNVNVSVSVDLSEIKRQVRREQTVDPKQVVALQQSTNTKQQQFQKRQPRQEPGVIPNQSSLSAESDQAPASSSTLTEENTETITVPRFEILDEEVFGAMPKATRVAVTIPEDYPRSLLLRRSPDQAENQTSDEFQQQLATVKEEIETQVKQLIATHLNLDLTQDPNPSAISVQTVIPQEPDIPEISIPITDKLFDWTTEWGGAILLVLLSLWALRSLNKSMPKLPDVEVEAASLQAALQPAEVEEDEKHHSSAFALPEASEREDLQTVVKENPEVTAAVISNWIRNSR
ncbi:MAG: hypothetical protein KDA65_03500 [Planctomycetaceae bacterium]|nr:hypothetical protein [Planctomycetaceae bacterium]